MEQRERRQWQGEVLSHETPCECRPFPCTDIRERWLVTNWILKLSQPHRVTAGDRSGEKEGKDWVKFAMKTLANADRFSCTARFTDRSQYVLPQAGRDGKSHNTGFLRLVFRLVQGGEACIVIPIILPWSTSPKMRSQILQVERVSLQVGPAP